MARRKIALKGGDVPRPTIEPYGGWDLTPQTISANTLTEIPTTIREGRQFVLVENLTDSDVYIASGIPDIYVWGTTNFDKSITCTRKYLKWTASGSGSNEYYAELIGGGDPGLTECKRMYGIVTDGGTEGLVTEGAGGAGSLSDHEWDWGLDDPGGTYNTIHFADATADPDSSTAFLVLYGYQNIPTVTGSGHHLGQYDTFEASFTSAGRIFAISSTESNLIISEFVGLVQY